jgi:hypothetical protein
MFLWKELRSFWIYRQKDPAILRVDTTLHFPHTLEILLEEMSDGEIEGVEKVLLRYLSEQEKPVAEAEDMADHALESIANKIPYSEKIMGWMEKKI